MTFRKSLILGLALYTVTAPAYAFQAESGPTDQHGAQFSDPDAQFDDMTDSGAGQKGMNFDNGDGTAFSLHVSGANDQDNNAAASGPAEGQSGEQMFEPGQALGMDMMRRH